MEIKYIADKSTLLKLCGNVCDVATLDCLTTRLVTCENVHMCKCARLHGGDAKIYCDSSNKLPNAGASALRPPH